MAKQRYINTKFWLDPFIMELVPLERYFYLYLLTNSHTNICGIYEISMRTMSFETGLLPQEINSILTKIKNKIVYIENWIGIKNFAKHQAVNDNVTLGIQKSLNEINPEILAKFRDYGIAYDSLSIAFELSESKSKPKSESKLKLKDRSEAQEFNNKIFEYNKELTGIDFKDTATDRMRYPRLIRQKFKDIEVVKGAMYQAWNQRKKSDGFYYWREGRMTLAKLYHRLIPEYLENIKQQDNSQKLYEMRSKLAFKST